MKPGPQRPQGSPGAGWGVVLAILTLLAVAVAVHISEKRRGLLQPRRQTSDGCIPTEGLVCTDVEHSERRVPEEE